MYSLVFFHLFFVLMILTHPRSTRNVTTFPKPTLIRSVSVCLMQVRARVRMGGNGRPLHIEGRVERRDAGIARQGRVRAPAEQVGRDVEVAVDDGHEQDRKSTRLNSRH